MNTGTTATDKQYSRNLGTGCGIELVSSPPITGDLDGDSAVDLSDLDALADNWLQSVQPLCDGDISGDGMVNFKDFAVLGQHWLEGRE